MKGKNGHRPICIRDSPVRGHARSLNTLARQKEGGGWESNIIQANISYNSTVMDQEQSAEPVSSEEVGMQALSAVSMSQCNISKRKV